MLVVETVVRIRREHAGGKPIKAIARLGMLPAQIGGTRRRRPFERAVAMVCVYLVAVA